VITTEYKPLTAPDHIPEGGKEGIQYTKLIFRNQLKGGQIKEKVLNE
jgi:hypothetical protein